jgi:hypothetical protein
MTLVFVVVAAGSVIAFIIRDLGNPGLAGWIIQVILICCTSKRIVDQPTVRVLL